MEALGSSERFEPDKYQDEVRERVLELINRKVAGEDITAAPSEAPQAQIIDLLEVGSSAGLNLLWDRYRYRYDAGIWGAEKGRSRCFG